MILRCRKKEQIPDFVAKGEWLSRLIDQMNEIVVSASIVGRVDIVGISFCIFSINARACSNETIRKIKRSLHEEVTQNFFLARILYYFGSASCSASDTESASYWAVNEALLPDGKMYIKSKIGLEDFSDLPEVTGLGDFSKAEVINECFSLAIFLSSAPPRASVSDALRTRGAGPLTRPKFIVLN